MNLGKSLKIALINKGMTQIELANKLSITPAHISRVANGVAKMNEDLLSRITTELDMKASDFVRLGEDS